MANELAKACNELSYRVRLPYADFDLAAFSASLNGKKNLSSWQRVTLKSKNAQGFHCHLNWRLEKGRPENAQLQAEFHRWKPEGKIDLEEPTAETVFDWVARYTTLQSREIHVHAEFVLSSEHWRTTILPLPWELPYGTEAPVVSGVEFDLRSKQEGMLGGFTRQRENLVELSLYADRTLAFGNFNIERDIKAFVSVAKNIVGER